MTVYDIKLDNIIHKYFGKNKNLNIENPINLVGKIINYNCIDNTFAIWGGGEHTENLHKYFSAELKNAKFIIDNNKDLSGKEILGYKVISPEELKNYQIDVILISSYSGALSIKKQIKSLNIKCKVIDFYEELKKIGVNLEGAFYGNPSIYMDLYDLRKKYEESNKLEEKENYINKIIYYYLSIRDFDNSKKFINEYISKGFNKANDFKILLEEIDSLIQDLKDKISKRNGNDILFMFFDSLRACDVYNNKENMIYLNEVLKESLYFTKAYSPSIFTYESMPSVLIESMPFKNSLYKRKTVTQEECPFIKNALNNKFKVKIYALNHWKIIEGEDIEYGEESNYASLTFWNGLCDLAESTEKDTLYILYFFQETHPPHICGYHSIKPISHITPFTCNDNVEQSKFEYITQYKDSLKYIDDQMKFYFNIMSSKSTKIIFSDHGQIIEQAVQPLSTIKTLAGWHTSRYHIPLIISGGNIIPKRNDKLYSTTNINEIINGIIDGNFNITNKEIVEVNFSKINNGVIVDKYKDVGYEDYLYGFKVFLSEDYKLVITGNGKIKVYLNSDEFNEVIDNKEREDIVEYFKINGCDFEMPIWQ